ncbi:hypothetical protein M9H77_35417 [Catharanthus roseus]|uniref:Uncharacterized protein n=1 Tax=Catharanthus roseus TaxID=4058 RepID=A0ACB9ZT69_CATRO|nr:hypothetical protein M9H77_35417 [Catharanthus roseus]
MQGQNTIEEVLYLSAKQDYKVFYRNSEDINMLSDIVISTRPIFEIREMRRLMKGKKNSTKRDKSHWEHMSVAHQKIQKSSGSGSSSCTGSGPWSSSGSGNWKNVRGDSNCGYRVVADFVFGDEYERSDVRRRMLYELEHSTNVYINLVGSKVRVNELVYRIHWPVDEPVPYQHWLETPDLFYIIANAFNPCVILIAQLGSTTVLPLYSYWDLLGGTLVIGLLTEQQHFI